MEQVKKEKTEPLSLQLLSGISTPHQDMQTQSGFTLLEVVITISMVFLFLGMSLSMKKGLFTLLNPIEKVELQSRIRLAELVSLCDAKSTSTRLGNRTIYFGSSGMPRPGSSGTFWLTLASGRKFAFVLSSMGRLRIQ